MNPNLKGKEAKERRVVAYKRERNENHVVAGRIRWWLMTKYPNGNEAYKAHEEELDGLYKTLPLLHLVSSCETKIKKKDKSTPTL